ncbi:ABC transporter substrate-binding protein [Sediminispirochaeta bajacaliforniensis]|uniref:ABC transporter substrate-binding protein n=1 Tax=Sediminispirochaeta bajacaliforniensis TaxID=148 RepID=UPI00035C8DFD|nr:ABC transporter substrate-binding protein [Sediminispirochaeta bajacaliforniensis]
MVKKLFPTLLSVLLSVGMLSGCGKSSMSTDASKASSSDEASQKTMDIEFWHAMSGGTGDLIQQLVDDYNASQSAVHVEAIYQGDYTTEGTKIQAAVASGNAPQIAQLEIGRIGMYAEAGALVDLKSYVKRDDYNIDDYYKGILDYSYYDDALIALPEGRSMPVLYYNADLFKSAGVSAPSTWDELKSAATILTRDGKYGYSCPIDPWYYLGLVITAGGQIYNEEGNGIGFNNESGAKPLYLWRDMIGAGTMYIPEGQDYNSSAACRNVFIAGTTAMIMQSCAQYKNLVNNCKFKVGVAYIPKEVTYSAIPGGSNFVMFTGSSEEKENAAWEFLKYMTSTETSARFSVGTGYLPPRKSILETDTYKSALEKYPLLDVAVGQLDYFVNSPFDEAYAEVKDTIVTNAIQACIINGVSPEDTVKTIADKTASLYK